jgi:hypothetical protein
VHEFAQKRVQAALHPWVECWLFVKPESAVLKVSMLFEWTALAGLLFRFVLSAVFVMSAHAPAVQMSLSPFTSSM